MSLSGMAVCGMPVGGEGVEVATVELVVPDLKMHSTARLSGRGILVGNATLAMWGVQQKLKKDECLFEPLAAVAWSMRISVSLCDVPGTHSGRF